MCFFLGWGQKWRICYCQLICTTPNCPTQEQYKINKAASDLPSATQKGENTVSKLETAAPQVQDSENDRKEETYAKSDIYNLPPESLPHKTTDEDILLATTAFHDQLLDEEKINMGWIFLNLHLANFICWTH